MDVGKVFPYEPDCFDLILATMVFNELPTAALRTALRECRRVLQAPGRLIATLTHPEFVARLDRNGKLSRLRPPFWTMPAAGALRVPVVVRSQVEYERLFGEAGFAFQARSVHPSTEVLNERPGLRHAGNVALGLILTCTKTTRAVPGPSSGAAIGPTCQRGGLSPA